MPKVKKIFHWLVFSGFCIYCLGMISLWLYQLYIDQQSLNHQLEAEGVEVTARVVDVQTYWSRLGRLEVEVTYTYTTEGINYTRRTIAHTLQTQGVMFGSRVQIRYAPHDPQISEIVGNQRNVSYDGYMPYALGAGSCWGILFLVSGGAKYIDWRLKRAAGQLVPVPVRNDAGTLESPTIG